MEQIRCLLALPTTHLNLSYPTSHTKRIQNDHLLSKSELERRFVTNPILFEWTARLPIQPPSPTNWPDPHRPLFIPSPWWTLERERKANISSQGHHESDIYSPTHVMKHFCWRPLQAERNAQFQRSNHQSQMHSLCKNESFRRSMCNSAKQQFEIKSASTRPNEDRRSMDVL